MEKVERKTWKERVTKSLLLICITNAWSVCNAAARTDKTRAEFDVDLLGGLIMIVYDTVARRRREGRTTTGRDYCLELPDPHTGAFQSGLSIHCMRTKQEEGKAEW